MSNNIKLNQCEIIQDLLPLYQDEICSGSSKTMIEEHLQSCTSCKAYAVIVVCGLYAAAS